MNDVQSGGSEETSVTSEGERFDQYATNYAHAINSEGAMRLTGESFEYYLERRLDLVQELLGRAGHPAPATALDFGCGAGDTQAAMRKRFPKARLLGVDASAESIRVARERHLPSTKFLVNDGAELPYADGSVDMAYSNGTFHHVDHAAHAGIARELHRVIKPGGHAFMFENNGLNPIVAWVMDHNELDRGAVRVPYWQLRRSFADAGFEIRGVHFYAFFPKFLEPLRRRESRIRWLPLGAQYVVWGQKA
jgi:trans-aconitate methyltransferase